MVFDLVCTLDFARAEVECMGTVLALASLLLESASFWEELRESESQSLALNAGSVIASSFGGAAAPDASSGCTAVEERDSRSLQPGSSKRALPVRIPAPVQRTTSAKKPQQRQQSRKAQQALDPKPG